MPELLTTTRTVAELWDLFGRGRLDLAPEFQRNSVWPSDAKAYLIDTILEHKLIAQELLGYSEADIRDVFIRMNKYVFQLSRQELRHARESGAFARFAAEVGAWSEWADLRVFT